MARWMSRTLTGLDGQTGDHNVLHSSRSEVCGIPGRSRVLNGLSVRERYSSSDLPAESRAVASIMLRRKQVQSIKNSRWKKSVQKEQFIFNTKGSHIELCVKGELV